MEASTSDDIQEAKAGLIPDATLSILSNVYKKCTHEKAKKQIKYPLDEVGHRVSYYTGVSLDFINQVVSNDELNILTVYNLFPLPICHRLIIYSSVCNAYDRQKLLNSVHFLNMYKKFKEDGHNISSAEFQRMLSLMKYQLVRLSNGDKCFIENPFTNHERFAYLKAVKCLYDNQQNIYYVDERYIDLKKKFNKPWAEGLTQTNSEELSDGYVFYHIISNKGYLCGISCAQLCYEDFYNWIHNLVLPKLPPNSTIVMDKSEYHGKNIKSYISPYDSKISLLEKLFKYKIPASKLMHKSELYELACKNLPSEENKYDIDEVLHTCGHKVLRLPYTLYDLSITELFWESARNKFKDQDIESIQDLNAAIIRELEYEYTEMDWAKLNFRVSNYVKGLYEIEINTDSKLSKHVFLNTKHVGVAKKKTVVNDDPIVIN